METQNPGCVAYFGSRKSGPIGGLGSKISVGCGGRNATAVHQGGAVFSGTALTILHCVTVILFGCSTAMQNNCFAGCTVNWAFKTSRTRRSSEVEIAERDMPSTRPSVDLHFSEIIISFKVVKT